MKQQSKQAALISAPQQTALTKALSLKGEIVAYHEVTLRAGNEMVQAAYRCGELLVEVRDVLKAAKTSSFENWIEQFLPFNRSAAYSYIKLATDLGKIENVRSRGQIIASADTISEAKRLISAVIPAAPAKPAPPPVPPAEPADDQDDPQHPLYVPEGPEPDLSENLDADPVEAEPAPAPQASVVLDLFDRPIPSQHKAAHELAALIASQARRLDPILREMLALADQQGGEFIPRAPLEIAIKAIKGQILGACYAFECPRCEGLIGKSCKSCGGKGYWPMEKKGKLSAADKTYLGID